MPSTIATATTIKAPLEQTLAFVRYHLRQGVRHMYLYFDDPSDPAISRLANDQRVRCTPCDEAHLGALDVQGEAKVQYKQAANAMHALGLAREAGIEWLVHMDGDELLYSPTSLQELFATAPPHADVVFFPVKEAVPQEAACESPFQGITLFKYYPVHALCKDSLQRAVLRRWRRKLLIRVWRFRRLIARMLGCDHPALLESFLLGYASGKAATRTSCEISGIGNHIPVADGSSLRVFTPERGAVLHFDCMGFEDWRMKWTSRVDGSANFQVEGFFKPDRVRTLKLFQSARESGSEQEVRSLYEQMYLLSIREKAILKRLGLLEEIALSEKLFDPLPD